MNWFLDYYGDHDDYNNDTVGDNNGRGVGRSTSSSSTTMHTLQLLFEPYMYPQTPNVSLWQ